MLVLALTGLLIHGSARLGSRFPRTLLIEEASRPTLDEVLDRAGGRAGGSVPLAVSVEILRGERDRS
jgi:hypothetical protein